MLKLTRLKIDKYRRVAPGTELVFDDGFNVLLGRNGTGKTTLLKLISMCLRSDFSELAQEEIAISYELRFLTVELLVRLENRRGEGRRYANFFEPAVEARIDVDVIQASFEYDVSIQAHFAPSGEVLRIRGTPSKAWAEDDYQREIPAAATNPFGIHVFGFVSSALNMYTPLKSVDDESTLLALCIALGQLSVSAYRFDESLAALKAMEGRSQDDSMSRLSASYVHLVWLKGTKFPKSGDGRGLFVFGRQFIPESLGKALKAHINEPGSVTSVTITKNDLVFLKMFVDIAELESAEMKMFLLKREVGGDAEELRFGDFKFVIHFRDGSVITHDLLSYGQKRLLAFLYYIDCNESTIVADELVNGLHHEWIEACIDAIGERQAFLTSQNPLLLDYLSFESAEQAARSFIVCRSELSEGRQQMRWANMPKEDAVRFFRGYLSGIQHVSEVLRTEGLW